MADVATAPISLIISNISIWELSIPAVCSGSGIGGEQFRELDMAFTHLSVCFKIAASTLLSKNFNFKSLILSF